MHVKHTSTKEKLERRLKSDREVGGGGLEMLKILTKLTLEENEILRSL